MNITSMILIVLVITLIVWRRTRAMSRPVKGNGLRLLLPLIILIPGILEFINPQLHLSGKEIVISAVLGLLFSIPMIVTTNYEVREDGQIYAKKSMAFIFALIGIVVIRLILRSYLSNLGPVNLGGLFYIMAVVYIFLWRIVSYVKFRNVYNQHRTSLSIEDKEG